MKLNVDMFIRTKEGIRKIINVWDNMYELNRDLHYRFPEGHCLFKEDIEKEVLKASDNLIDLVEYMDLLVIENKVKDINNKELYFFNPVRCDGFTTFENNQHCMIINMDYIIPIDNIKIYQILTKEQFEQMSYKVVKKNEK